MRRNQYTKLFSEEVREKKKTASGVHSKTGKRGYVGRMKFGYENMGSKEKREYTKPSEVRTYNMNEVMKWDDFQQFNSDDQKTMLQNWRKSSSNNEIMKKLGISKKEYYDLINALGVEKKGMKAVRMNEKRELTEDEMKKYRKEIIPYELFKYVVRPQQSELLKAYEREFPVTSDLAEAWGLKINSVYNVRSNIKRWEEKNTRKENEKPDNSKRLVAAIKEPSSKETPVSANNEQLEMKQLNNTTPSVKEIEVETPAVEKENPVVQENEHVKEQAQELEVAPTLEGTGEENKETTNLELEDISMKYQLNGRYSATEICKKLQKLIYIIEDEQNEYEIEVRLKEIRNPDQEVRQMASSKPAEPDKKDNKELLLNMMEMMMNTLK